MHRIDLTSADASVINASAALCLMVVWDETRQVMLLDLLAETVNTANWENPRMAPLLTAVRLLLDRRPTFARPISRHYAAELRAIHLAVNEVIWWRMAEAHAAWREQKGHAA